MLPHPNFDVFSTFAVPTPPLSTIVRLIAQEPQAAPPTLFSPFTMFVGASFFLFYFLVLAPEKRRKAAEEVKRSSLRKNDRVVTVGGIHGTVAAAGENDDFVTIKVDNNTRLKVSRSAISQVIDDSVEDDPASPSKS